MKEAYEYTGLWLILTMIVMPLVGMRAQAWRLSLLWTASLIATALIAFLAPAYGSFSQIDPAAAVRLPGNAGRFAFDAFRHFRFADDPMLSIHSIAAVICFPSFHTICALLLVQAWWSVRWLLPVAVALAGATIVSTLPIGGHYFIDLPAGLVVWWGCTRLADYILRDRTGDGVTRTMSDRGRRRWFRRPIPTAHALSRVESPPLTPSPTARQSRVYVCEESTA
ncbi:MAG: phosphatase PAP2 family protein [Sphingomonas sp.]|nr:phosphatase PAP2 family protein [Sphingomonas sp.]